MEAGEVSVSHLGAAKPRVEATFLDMEQGRLGELLSSGLGLNLLQHLEAKMVPHHKQFDIV